MKLPIHKLQPNRGYVIMLETVLFMAIAVAIIVGVINPIISGYTSARAYMYSKQAFLATDSGIEEALYRLENNKPIGSSVTVSLDSGASTVDIVTNGNNKTITSAGSENNFDRTAVVNLILGTGVSFHYGIQSGQGGFQLNNSSSVTGNIFSNGQVIGAGGNLIRGEVISAGSSGLVSGIHATGTVYAHLIQNTTADKDAYYATTITGSTVSGSACPNSHCHPGTTDQSPADLPISDSQISEWETDAAAGGTATCSGGTYTITSAVSLGPIKIPCNLNIKNTTVTITGPIWVVGNIDVKGSTVELASGLGVDNVAVIADDAANSTVSSLISTDTGTTFYAAGCPSACVSGSYIFLISQNNSAETGGSTNAISLGQSSSGIIAYASHGQITVGQSVSLKEVTAYLIILGNTANVVYDTGLPNTLFEAGPSGGYDLLGWSEI